MYSQVQHHQKAQWPNTHVEWRELLYMRSWQASGLVPITYYFLMIVGFIQFISNIVLYTVELGAGGFFLGLLIGAIIFIALLLFGRITSEIFLSIFAIRDTLDEMSSRGSNSNRASAQAPAYSSPSNIASNIADSYQASSYQQL